jgi:hypothetical protein
MTLVGDQEELPVGFIPVIGDEILSNHSMSAQNHEADSSRQSLQLIQRSQKVLLKQKRWQIKDPQTD